MPYIVNGCMLQNYFAMQCYNPFVSAEKILNKVVETSKNCELDTGNEQKKA